MKQAHVVTRVLLTLLPGPLLHVCVVLLLASLHVHHVLPLPSNVLLPGFLTVGVVSAGWWEHVWSASVHGSLDHRHQ